MDVSSELLNIKKSYDEKKLSHAFLIETDDIIKSNVELKKLIKYICCQNKHEIDSDSCNVCYQIENDCLPNIIFINPDGSSIKKQQIIDLKQNMQMKPIYTKYNVYVINEADKLNSSSANTILKFLEEPEEGIIGFYVTNNKDNVIDTIKSRCQIIKIKYNHKDSKNFEFNYYDEVLEYLNIIQNNKSMLLYNKNVLMNKFETRIDMINFFKELFMIYRNDIDNVSENTKYENLKLINSVVNDLEKNGNINLILDNFVIDMR